MSSKARPFVCLHFALFFAMALGACSKSNGTESLSSGGASSQTVATTAGNSASSSKSYPAKGGSSAVATGTTKGTASPAQGGASSKATVLPQGGSNSATGGAGSLGGAGSTGTTVSSVGLCEAGTTYMTPTFGTAEKVTTGTGSGLFEGTVWLADRGVLLFSDMTFGSDPVPSTLRELTPPTSVRPFLENSGSNGLAVTKEGTVIAACHDIQGLARIDPVTGAKTPYVTQYDGKGFNSPNDLTIRSDGTIFFTDPDFQLGNRKSAQGFTGVYRVTPNGDVTLVDKTIAEPNGIALSPDEKTLYVAANGAGKIVKFAVAEDGSTTSPTDFATVSEPDGVGVDCAGNLYVASHTPGKIEVFAPTGGAAIATITVAKQTTNLAFGGPDRKTIYASAGKAIYRITSSVPGYPY